jgi:type I restriction-modification system DNA methylase subunit
MTTRASRLLELRRQAQDSHGYAASSRWYASLSVAMTYFERAETAPSGTDKFRDAWHAIYNVYMMNHQSGDIENITLSNWIARAKTNPLIQKVARNFSTDLLEAIKQAEQDLLRDTEKNKWRHDGRNAVENWLKKRNQNQDLSGENACSSAFLIGRDLRNAVSHPKGLDLKKTKVRKALTLAGEAYLNLAETVIQTTIEHPDEGTTGRTTAYRFFLYPYLKNSDGFLSDYYLERLLPDQELGAFSEDDSKDQLKLVQKELQLRRATLVPATDVAVTIAQWCQAVLFPSLGMQPQPGPRIVAEQAVFEPAFALAQVGVSIQPEYQGKAAGQELDALIWVLPWREGLDSKADVAGLEGLSAMEVAQQALVQADVAWGVVTNGKLLRLLHKASAHRPRSFLEVDLETISVQWIQPQARLAFRYMLGLFSQVSFVERDSENRTRLDRVLAQSERHGKEIGDELKQNVFKALEELGDGFLYLMRQNPELARRWQQRQGSTAPIEQYLDSDELLRTIYEESLTLLYRLLFLFYAESRDLLPMHDELYRDTYSLEALRDDIISVHDDPDPRRFFSQGATDLDVRLRELFGLIDVGFGNLIPAYNGGLFDPEQHPFLESFKVGDYYLARAIDLLSRTRPQNGQVRGEGRKKVTYRDLDVRHLGEIYEGLLEYSAHIAREEQVIFERKKNSQKYEEYVAASELKPAESEQLAEYRQARAENPEFPSLPRGCSVTGVKEPGQYFLVYGGKESKRKSSGSYYTPDYIVQYIVENTLGPLVRGENREGDKQNVPLTADEILNLKVLDPAMGSGHFLVAATEYLARAYGQALIREGRDSDGAMSDAEFIRYKRMVAERCIYGVDINPMAVELAKLSLWLFTMDPQRPLSFLDHHLKCGNALIGGWIKDLGALPGTKQQPGQSNLFEARFLAQIPAMVGNVFGIMHRETMSREDIADKKALDQTIEELKQPFRNIADAWVAYYFGEQARDYDAWLVNPEETQGYRSQSAAQQRFFHWELEFPEVWFKKTGEELEAGGFDVIIGNPPYANLQTLGAPLKLGFLPKNPYWRHFYRGQADIHYYFLRHSLVMLSESGTLGCITSRYWMEATYADTLRQELSNFASTIHIVDFRDIIVFEGVSVHTSIMLLKKGTNKDALYYMSGRPHESPGSLIGRKDWISANLAAFGSDSWRFEKQNSISLHELTSNFPRLSEYFRVGMGVSTGLNEAFYIDAAEEGGFEAEVVRNLVKNSDIARYVIISRDERILFTPNITDPRRIPRTISHLRSFEDRLRKRRGCGDDSNWFKYKEDQNYDLAENFDFRVITPYRGSFPRFAIAPKAWHGCTDTYSLVVNRDSNWDEYAVLAVLNSDFIRQYFERYGKKKGDVIEFFTRPIQNLPIPYEPHPSLSALAKEISSKATTVASLLAQEPARLNVLFRPTYEDVSAAYERANGKNSRITKLCKEIADIEQQINLIVKELYAIS